MGVVHDRTGHAEALVTWADIMDDHTGVTYQQIAETVLDATTADVTFTGGNP
jgi:hypothetical protein